MDEFIAANERPRPSVELTTVVGSFLCWDETGGHGQVLNHGNAGLPFALETEQHFHGNLLRRDLHRIFGRPIAPDFSITGPYLKSLQHYIGSPDDIWRCASMVSFERHAELVITALWQRLAALFDVDKDSLEYFTTHVGGDDAAEDYHVQMTERLIDRIVTGEEVDRFLGAFDTCFTLHLDWSADICRA
ncbi:MAG: hypothetical protein OXQ29_23525 [Rhodospirillaceae bacterium]|nr:hypothetical protein [Rhodospirillaceae bacterium]